MNKKGIIGAIIGDIVGSRFEWANCRSTEFELFTEWSDFTDDTVMTIAVADWLTVGSNLSGIMRDWANGYPNRGYGGMFYRWLFELKDDTPYNSFGNGAGMRVSPCGFFAHTLDETLDLAKQSAEVSHNHPEGIKGAQAIASSIFLARTGKSKEDIKAFIEATFHYNLDRTCDEIRFTYEFDETCQGSCPEAIIAFLESDDYESAIRLAVSLGGDSDTIACMTGGVSAAYYGVPDAMIENAKKYLPDAMIETILNFEKVIADPANSHDIRRRIAKSAGSAGENFELCKELSDKTGQDIIDKKDVKRITPEFVDSLCENEIFVFGCRHSGRHWEGAASFALENFGAVFGQGEGLQGKSYAIPTAGVSLKDIKEAVDRFITFASNHPELHFFVTAIGCGLGGWRCHEIAPLFRNAARLDNVSLPKDFWSEL